MGKTRVGMKGAEFGKKGDPLEDSGVLRESAFQPTESFFFIPEGGVNRGNQRCRNATHLSRLHQLREDVLRFRLPTHSYIGDSKTATRKMRGCFGFLVKSNRFREVALFSIGGGQI